jgi:hypothetical protein
MTGEERRQRPPELVERHIEGVDAGSVAQSSLRCRLNEGSTRPMQAVALGFAGLRKGRGA